MSLGRNKCREWAAVSGAKLLPIGALGPLPGKDVAMHLDWSAEEGYAADAFNQNAAFVIAHIENPFLAHEFMSRV